MWRSIRFNSEYGMFPNLVLNDLVDWHRGSIINNSSIISDDSKDYISLDPGGMVSLSDSPMLINILNNSGVSVRKEHIIWLTNYFFIENTNENKPNGIIKFLDDDIIRIALYCSTLYLSHDIYLKISKELTNIYSIGVESYMKIVGTNSENIIYSGLKHCALSSEKGEA